MKETNPVWIAFYKEKLPKLVIKLNKLDPDNKTYWKRFTAIYKEIERIKGKLGIEEVKNNENKKKIAIKKHH